MEWNRTERHGPVLLRAAPVNGRRTTLSTHHTAFAALRSQAIAGIRASHWSNGRMWIEHIDHPATMPQLVEERLRGW